MRHPRSAPALAPLAALLAALALAAQADPTPPASKEKLDARVEAQSPQAHASEVAARIAIVKRALHEVRRAAAELKDLPLRSALEAQLQAPWLPPEAWVFAHPAEAEAKLRAAGLLIGDKHLLVPPLGAGSLDSAPGGPCVTGHHGYPGGLAVHEAANLAHARALAAVYKSVYGVELNDDTMKAGTLPWDASGDCPHGEPQLAGTALHHTLGLAAAILRHLPGPLIVVIASAHQPPTAEHAGELCNQLRAAGILALGDEAALACPALDAGAPRQPLEAFVNNSSDIDYPLTVAAWNWYAAQTPGGWERFAALEADGSDLAAWERACPRP